MKKWTMLIGGLCLTACLLAGCGDKGEEPNSSSMVSNNSTVSTVAPTPVPVQMAKAVKVNAPDGLNIRSQASTDSEILGLADDGELLPLLVEEEKDGWFQVEYQGKPAYVSAEYAAVQEVTLEEYNRLRSGGDASTTSTTSSSSETSTTSTTSTTSETSSPSSENSASTPKEPSSSSSSSDPAGDLQDGE